MMTSSSTPFPVSVDEIADAIQRLRSLRPGDSAPTELLVSPGQEPALWAGVSAMPDGIRYRGLHLLVDEQIRMQLTDEDDPDMWILLRPEQLERARQWALWQRQAEAAEEVEACEGEPA